MHPASLALLDRFICLYDFLYEFVPYNIFSFEKNDVDLTEGDFSTHLIRFLGEWHINPWISIIANFQYDDVSDVVGLFTRFRWILTPGSDLYLVYTHNWGEDPTGLRRYRLQTLSRAATMKLNYTYRF